MAARGGIYRRQTEEQESDDEEVDDEPGVIHEYFVKYVAPMFGKEKKWFWWNIGFFGAATMITRTHGLYQLDWMVPYLTKESPLDKAMQQQIPQHRM